MRPLHALQVAVIAVGVALLLFTWCSRNSADAPVPEVTGLPPAAARTPTDSSIARHVMPAEVQAAFSSYPGFVLEMLGHGLMLPEWGAIDGRSRLQVNMLEHMVRGTVARRGDPDGTYDILYAQRTAFFKRSTCDTWSRLPGGGPDLFLGVFGLWHTAFADAELVAGPSEEGYDSFTGTIAGFGPVSLIVERSSGLPVRMSSDDDARTDGAVFDIRFKDWGDVPQVDLPDGNIEERRPGSGPC